MFVLIFLEIEVFFYPLKIIKVYFYEKRKETVKIKFNTKTANSKNTTLKNGEEYNFQFIEYETKKSIVESEVLSINVGEEV